MSIRPNRALGWLAALALGFGLAQTFAPAQGITIPNTFTNDTTADGPQVNANFAALAANALNRNGGTLGGTLNLNGQTLSGAATASGAWAFSSTVSITGATTVGDLRGTAETITATGTVNDQALGATTTILRLNNATLLTLTGLTGCSAGRVVILQSVGAGNVELRHQNASSSAANRFVNFATSGNTPLFAGVGTATLACDGTLSRWVLVQHEQGGWITPTFAAGDFTASGTQTWTLAAGDVTTMKYRLTGRTLQVVFNLVSTTVGGAADSQLRIGNAEWGSFTITAASIMPTLSNDNGAGVVASIASLTAAGTFLPIYKSTAGAGNWAAATDTTGVYGQLTFEVN